MAEREEIHEIEVGFDGKLLKSPSFATGIEHRITFKPPVLLLNHRYHDDAPVTGAGYEVELEDGRILRGHLDDNGQAEVRGMQSRPLRVRYEPEPLPYEIADEGTNPGYLAHFTKTSANQLAEARIGPAPEEIVPGGKSLALDAIDWIWGTLKGGFNEKQSVSQIIVDALIGMIPLVGDVTAVRDLIAIIIGLAQDPKKRESKLEWLALVVLLFALIPVIGGAIKGVGKLLMKGGKEAAKASKHFREMVGFLNRIGMGDAPKWLKELNLESHTGELLGRWRELMHRLDMVLDSIQLRFKGILPPSMLDYLAKLKSQIQELGQKGEAMIPDAVKDLSERLKAAQRQLYQGDWHSIPKNLKTSTREIEARLVDVPGGKKWEVENMHFPPNGRDSFIKREDWPDLSEGKYVKKNADDVLTYKVIPCFSGPMRAVKIPPGTKIYRVVSPKGDPAGAWWVYALPESGKEWREGLAVLDSWSGNGYYVEMTVPESGLFVWEGKAASQVENSPEAVNSMGQYLPGGQVQLFVDLKFSGNAKAVSQIGDFLPTHWADHMGLHVPPKEAEASFLGPFEVESKNRLPATLVEKGTRKNRNEKSE